MNISRLRESTRVKPTSEHQIKKIFFFRLIINGQNVFCLFTSLTFAVSLTKLELYCLFKKNKKLFDEKNC